MRSEVGGEARLVVGQAQPVEGLLVSALSKSRVSGGEESTIGLESPLESAPLASLPPASVPPVSLVVASLPESPGVVPPSGGFVVSQSPSDDCSAPRSYAPLRTRAQ